MIDFVPLTPTNRARRSALALVAATILLLLAPTALFAQEFAPGPDATQGTVIQGFLDGPASGITVPVARTVRVYGWAVNPKAQGWAGIDKLRVYQGTAMSGKLLAEGRVGQKRPDVAKALGNPAFEASGFEATFNTSLLGAGTHTVTVFVGTPNEGWWTKSFSIVVQDFGFATIDEPASDTAAWCIKDNPSCARDNWWTEWNELQSSNYVQYTFLGPGLVTERRFAEAVTLIWQWPTGKELLKEAAANGVTIVADASPGIEAFGWYQPAKNLMGINKQYAETSTWMLADVMAHELKHASDDHSNLFQRDTYSDCISAEQRAFHIEIDYLKWLATRYGGLPEPAAIRGLLSAEDQQLYADLANTLASKDIDAQVTAMYYEQCSEYTGAPPRPTAPPASAAPSSSDLEVNITRYTERSAREIEVPGEVCNRSKTYAVVDLTLFFVFTGSAPASTSKFNVGDVRPGECKSFTAVLAPPGGWTRLRLDDATWTWQKA